MLRLLLALSSNWMVLFIGWAVFAFSFFGKFLFSLLLLFLLDRGFHAAIGCLLAVSTLTPMAQMKPSSSRPTAVITLRWSLPAAASLA